jgi:hypothetical protein
MSAGGLVAVFQPASADHRLGILDREMELLDYIPISKITHVLS